MEQTRSVKAADEGYLRGGLLSALLGFSREDLTLKPTGENVSVEGSTCSIHMELQLLTFGKRLRRFFNPLINEALR